MPQPTLREAATRRPKIAPTGAPPPAGPVLLPISPRPSGNAMKQDRDELARASWHKAGDATSPAPSPATGRSRKSVRRVTFGEEEIRQFEAVGKMRSIR